MLYEVITNEAFLAEYPEIEWFPHFFILDADGTLAESYDTRGLETDGVYDEAKFLDFLAERAGESRITSYNVCYTKLLRTIFNIYYR